MDQYFNKPVGQHFSAIHSIRSQNERWFCPCVQPPLVSDLDGKFKANNDAIVSFAKTDSKFKMVTLNLAFITLKSLFYVINLLEIEHRQVSVQI